MRRFSRISRKEACHEKGRPGSGGGSILRGRRPFLSIEITKQCPLRCPGCYAYEPEHLGAAGSLRQLADLQGKALITGVLEVVERLRPLHVSIVGGEPLVRYRELDALLPRLAAMGVEVQLVTSAVRPIPVAWKELRNLHLAVSVDGLQPEHDRRRAPPTYDRILKHIAGHRVRVHLHHHTTTAPAPGLLKGVRGLLVKARGGTENLVQHLYASRGRTQRGTPDSSGSSGFTS